MPNYRPQGLTIAPYVPKAASDTRLAPIPHGGGQAASALAQVGASLAGEAGQVADQLAADEGRRQGLADGTDPNWRPSDGWTVRARAADRAASDVYLSNLSARFHADALDLFERTKDDPAGFRSAYGGLVAGYRRAHVFPEVDGAFTATATNLGAGLQRSALGRYETLRQNRDHAALLGNMATRQRAAQQLLVADPHDPIAEASLARLRDEDLADIRAQVSSGALTAVQGEKLILDRQAAHQSSIVAARAATLKTGSEIDAYRARLKKDFAAGKLEGLIDFDGLDADLAKLSKQRRVETDHAVKTLRSDLGDLLERQQKGLDGSADWAAIEARAKTLGPVGLAEVDTARQKLAIRRRLSALGPDEADRLVLDVEAAAKAGPRLSPEKTVIRDRIAEEAARAGLPVDAVTAIVSQESGFDPARTVATSSAFGLFQLLRAERDKAGLGDTADVEAQIPVGIAKLKANWQAAKTALGRDPTAGEFYAVYYQGLGAGPKILADPSGDFRATLDAAGGAGWGDKVIAANPWLSGVRTNADFVEWTTRTLAKRTGVTAPTAEVIADARDFAEKRRQLVSSDPLLAAQRDGLVPEVSAVDFAAPPADLARAFRSRVIQADVVADAYRRAPDYIRPVERDLLKARLAKGGDEALATVTGLLAGAGTRTSRVLAEVGGMAPHLAHAAQVTLSTGDPSFARQVAEAQAARAVPGAQIAGPKAGDVERVMRTTLGASLQGLDAAETARTAAAVTAWAELEMARRGIAPNMTPNVEEILAEGFQRARGRLGAGAAATGGVADIAYGPPGWVSSHGSTIKVQVPADVRTERFGDVLAAITDADLAGLSDPPSRGDGKPMTAAELRRLAPVFGPGGYRFATIDPASGQATPLAAKSGAAFTLPWADLAARLRARVPDAFR